MNIVYIIPTLNRPSLKRTIESIKKIGNWRGGYSIVTCDSEKCAGSNRNKALSNFPIKTSDWIVFVDDDDYLEGDFIFDLNNNHDVVVLKMKQGDKIVPDIEKYGDSIASLKLRGNIGINFAIKTSFYLKHNFKFDTKGVCEDYRFFQKLLEKTNKVHITEDIHYFAPVSNHIKNKEMKTLKGVKYGLYIATPFYSEDVKVQYMESMISTHNTMNKAGIRIVNQFLYNTSLITKARNECISNFMNKTDLDYFLFIDSDISWDGNDIIKLMNYDKPLVCGTYPKKHLNWMEIQKAIMNNEVETSKNLIEKTSEYTIYEKEGAKLKDGLLEVNRVGTGFMMIKRDLIKKLAKKYKELMYDEKGEKGYGFFESSIMDGQHLSEDYSFCERVKSIGEKVYIDPSIELSHHGGNIRFYGNYNEHLKYGNKK